MSTLSSPARPGKPWILPGLLGALLFIFAGCATPPPPAQPAKARSFPATQQTLAQAAKSAGLHAGPWPSTDWWRVFHDAALDRLMQASLQDNPDLKVAAKRLHAADELVRVRSSVLLPRIDATASATQTRYARDSIHGVLNGQSFLYTIINPVDLNYHLDLWGSDQAHIRTALGLARAQAAELAQARLLLGQQVAQAYFALVAIETQLQLARAMASEAETLLHLAQVRTGAGLASRIPVQAEAIRLAAAREKLLGLQARSKVLRDELAALAGQGPDWGQGIQVLASAGPDSLALPADLPLQLLARRPDIAAARWRVEAARASVRGARAAFYPDVNLRVFAGLDSIRLGDLLNPLNLAHAVGPSLRLPLFEGGQLRANLDIQTAQYEAAVESYNGRLLSAVRQVADALANWQSAHDQLAVRRQAIQAAETDARLAALRYKAGLIDRRQALTAAYALDRERSQLAALQASAQQAASSLFTALGGGYEMPNKS